MKILVNFEIYPGQAVINASRYGATACAPPVAVRPRQFIEIDPDHLHEIVRQGTLSLHAPREAAGWTWRIRVGCQLVGCAWHHRHELYLARDETDMGTLIRNCAIMQRIPGWFVNQVALEIYAQTKK